VTAPVSTNTSNFLVSFRVLSPERREAVGAVYAFCRRADDAVDEAPNREAARTALSEVAQELEEVFAGGARTPEAERLLKAVRAFRLPRRPFDELIEGVTWDLEGRRYGTRADLRAYCYRVASTVGLLCVRIFGCKDPACDVYASELGVALQWTNILRDVGADLAQGRIYLPAESLVRHGLTENDLRCPDARAMERITALVREEAGYARACFTAAEAALPPGERSRVLAGEIMATIYRTLLGKVERAGARVLERKVRVSSLHRAWLALGLYARDRLRNEAPVEA
jgi:phytoene synthase